MRSKNIINKIMYHAAIASLLLCNPLYSQSMPADEGGLDENGMAMTIMKNTLANNPNSKIAKITCAKVLLKNGNRQEAEALLLQVLEMDPTNRSANKILREMNARNQSEVPQLQDAHNAPEIPIEPAYTEEPVQAEESIQPPPAEVPLVQNKAISEDSSTTAFAQETMPAEQSPVLAEVTTPTIVEAPVTSEQAPASALSLPSKDEILRRAKEKALKKYAETKAEKEGISLEEVEANRKSAEEAKAATPVIADLIEPITLEEAPAVPQDSYYSSEEKKNTQTRLVTPVQEPSSATILSDSEEKMVFTPYIVGQNKNVTQDKTTVAESKTLPKPALIDTRKQLSNTAVKNFLRATTQSFSVNLDEALCKVERNELAEADAFLNKAAILAVASKDTKKIYDVQLSRAVIYIYQCNFEKYGKHIMGLRKGISDEVYNSLNEMYKVGISLPDERARTKFAAKIALDSGHFRVAHDLASKVRPQDADTQSIMQICEQNLSKINGEALLNKGSYMGALEYFEQDNDEVEAGRTYFAISKSLDEIGDYAEAKIAEAFGKSCIMNCLNNDPNNPKANLYLALYFLDQGNKDQAKEAIRRGLNSQSDNELVTSKLLNLSENL